MSPLQAVAVTTLSRLCKQKMARKGRREGDNNRQKAERERARAREEGSKSVSEEDRERRGERCHRGV